MPVLRDPRHERFCQGLAELKPSAEAYEAAGFKRSGPNARKLRRRPEIQARVHELCARAAELGDVTRARTLVELARIGHANLADFFEKSGVRGDQLRLKDITELPRELSAALSSLEFDKHGRPKLKLHDKVGALDKIGKALGMWKDVADVSVGITLADLVAMSYGGGPPQAPAPSAPVIEGAALEIEDAA